MRNNYLKKIAKALYFRPDAIRRIQIGPLRGMKYRVGEITGLSAWYSGAEREHQKAFKSLIKAGDTAIDVGANWGLHTLYLSKLVGPTGRILAIEPFPPAIKDLNWHLRANGCSNVEILECALSESDGASPFSPGESAYTGGLADARPSGPSHQKLLEVKTRRLDSIIEELEIGNTKLIKVDVEGAETKVLLGARKTIEQHRPFFIVDLHTPEQDVSVARLLTDWGYKLSRLSGPPILDTSVGWPHTNGVWGTILARPTE